MVANLVIPVENVWVAGQTIEINAPSLDAVGRFEIISYDEVRQTVTLRPSPSRLET
jgi:hypothetical protein